MDNEEKTKKSKELIDELFDAFESDLGSLLAGQEIIEDEKPNDDKQ